MTNRISRITSAGVLALGAASAQADQVILDDLIVDGSACIGQDCVNGESFGFDTLRLKENNLRIKFQDTSTSASFPSNDWQITANDSSNGGANKFSIDDIDGGRTPFTIEAAARANALYVEADGDIGIGTNNPVVDLHVKTGNTPTLRLEQDGSSGFAAQSWDVAGNETNFFVRDATSGSTLPFRVFPSAPTNALTIEGSTGDIGMGTQSPDGALDIEGTGTMLALMTSSDNGAVQWRMKSDSGNRRVVAINSGDTTETQIVMATNKIELAGPTNTTDLWATVDVGGITLPAGASFTVGAQNLNVPDYVFGADYDLMPLTELAAFIETNSHLPRVPSAAEVQASGLDMTAMQLILLEKVEELTLYTLAQERELETLRQRLGTVER